VAVDEELGLARQGALPWHLPSDLAHFKRVTSEAAPGQRNAVFMGRATWESIPDRFRPLPGRVNLVLTGQAGYPLPEAVLRAGDIGEALDVLSARPEVGRIFCVGGAAVYAAAVLMPECRRLYLTRVAGRFGCDRFFPGFDELYEREAVLAEGADGGLGYRIELWQRSA
jgi:dihydrofolate reductase